MKLASYHGTRSGLMGLSSILIRFRLAGLISHSEILFEPGDGVDELMPDGTTEPVDGAYWCVSSVGLERLPERSKRRAGHLGGVRFKRLVPDPARWTLDAIPGADPMHAAAHARSIEGDLYDWQQIFGRLAWIIPDKAGRVMCSEFCALILGISDAWRFDPCALQASIRRPLSRW